MIEITISTLIHTVSLVVTALLVLLMLFTFRKPQAIGFFSPVISGFFSLLLLGVYWLISGAQLRVSIALVLISLGGIIGLLLAMTTRLYREGKRVMGKQSWLILLGWGSSLLVTQLLTLTGAGLAASIGLMGLVFSTGTTLGRDLNLFVRRLRVE